MNRKPMIFVLTILVAIAIAGLAPVLTAMAAPGPAFDLKFAGVITNVSAQPDAPLRIAGQDVFVDGFTRIRLSTSALEPGMWAEVSAKRLPDEGLLAVQMVVMAPEMRLKGPVSTMPDGGTGAWTVAGQVIQVTPDTRLSERGGVLEVGAWAEVYALEDPDGVLTATRIRGIEVQENIEVYGALQSCSGVTCTLSAVPLALNADTLMNGEPQTGLLAHASAALQDDQTLLALLLKVEWQEPGGVRAQVQLNGAVENLPPSGLNGIWTVAGQEVAVTSSTAINQAKGLVEAGAQVQVLGWPAVTKVVAAQITVLSSPSGSAQSFYVAGPVEAIQGTGAPGTWTIAGQQVEVTRQTRLHGTEQIRLGEPVEAGGLQLQSGVRVATWLRTRTQGGPGPQPSTTPQPGRTPQPSRTPGKP